MKPCKKRAFFDIGAGVVLLGAGAISVSGAGYPGMGGGLTTLSTPTRQPGAVFASLSGRMSSFFPDLYYHLAFGSVGAGICPELSNANQAKELLIRPPRAAGPHFRPAMPPGSYFNWGRVKPAFAFGGNHFYFPAKPLLSIEVASHAKPVPLQFPEFPNLNQKAPGDNYIIDDPLNVLEHRFP